MASNVLLETLDSSKKKNLTATGTELESPRLAVCSADHSATRPNFFKISVLLNNPMGDAHDCQANITVRIFNSIKWN